MHRGKAAKQMTKYNVLRSLGMREYYYFISSCGCLVEVLQWHIEVVDALVDVVRAAVLNTLSVSVVNIFVLITFFKHKPVNPKP